MITQNRDNGHKLRNARRTASSIQREKGVNRTSRLGFLHRFLEPIPEHSV
jgi:hypothetical protein